MKSFRALLATAITLSYSTLNPAAAGQMRRFVCAADDATRVYATEGTRGNVAISATENRAHLVHEFELFFDPGWIRLPTGAPGSLTTARDFRVIASLRGRTLFSTVALTQDERGAPITLNFMFDQQSSRYGLAMSSTTYFAFGQALRASAALDTLLAHCWPQNQ